VDVLELLRVGFTQLIQPANGLLAILGTFVGIVFGVIPGLTGTICLVLLLPLTYAMEPVQALVLMAAVYCGAVFGGAISAITLNIPGTPEAICTTFDGHPMAKKGLAGKAIGGAIEVSALGGFVSVLVLLLLGPLVANWALGFSSAEYFSLILMGLCCVSAITGKSLTKGFIAMFLGALVGTIGTSAITGTTRFSFGSTYLAGGLEFIPILIGVFAISEFLIRFEEAKEVRGGYAARSEWTSLKELWRLRTTIGISGILGFICGVIPGMGATLASFLGYGTARAISKRGSEFGTGILDGVVAPETANNSATGGAMLPLLTLGIPGGTATAVMLGVLLLHGIEPGPKVFRASPDLVGATCASMLAANILLLVMGFYLARPFSNILKIRWGYLVTGMLVFCFIGAFCLRANFFDVFTMIGFGILGYFMRKNDYPLAPFILAIILGHMLEEQFLRTMLRSGNDFLPFVTRPVSLAFLIFALFLLVFPLIGRKKIMMNLAKESRTTNKGELVGLLLLIGICIYAFIAAFDYREAGQSILNSAALWPWLCSVSLISLSVMRLAHISDIKSIIEFDGGLLAAKSRRALIGGGWFFLYFAAEALVGHIFATILIPPFLLHFSGIRNKKLLSVVPLGLMLLTTIVFTVLFYTPLPTGVGIFHDLQEVILFKLESLIR